MALYVLVAVLLVGIIAIQLVRGSSTASQASGFFQPTSPRGDSASRKPAKPGHSPTRRNEEGWLRARWKMAREHQKSGVHERMFPEWYFDKATEAQLDRLDLLDVLCDRSTLTKGQASDLIGMFEHPSRTEVAMLEFFGVSAQGWKRTRVRHEIAKLLQDPANTKAWEERSPAADQWSLES